MKSLVANNIIHRDLKPENVMFHDGIVKLCDFGFCTQMESGKTDNKSWGSPLYMAPELLFKKDYGLNVDIYSFGCLVYELLFGICPYETNKIQDLYKMIEAGKVNFPKKVNTVSIPLERLIRRMLKTDPSQRITWNEIFQHQIFAEKS